MRAFPWRPSLGRGAGGLALCQNVPMLPKPLQFVLLLPIAFGPLAPRFFAGLFLLGLVGVALWWLRLVVALLLGER